jgi:DNA polymerase-3 subunit alpha
MRVDARKVNKKVLESLIKVGAFSVFGKRSSLLSSLEEIRSKIVRPKNLNDNQQGLFDLSDVDKESTRKLGDILLNDIEEFTNEEIEDLERQLLGFSLSAKPIIELISPLLPLATHHIHDINPEFETKEVVKLAGVIKQLRIIITKTSGQEMAFIKFEDGTGSIDLVVFPRIYEKNRDFLTENTPVLIKGKVDYREKGLSFIVDDIKTQELINQTEERVFIKIPKNCEKSKLKELKTLLDSNPGGHYATLVFEDAESQKIDLKTRINWDVSLAKEISQLLSDKV